MEREYYQNSNPNFTTQIFAKYSQNNWAEDVQIYLKDILNSNMREFFEDESEILELKITTTQGDIYYQPSMNSNYHPKLSYLMDGNTGVTVENDKLYILPDQNDWLMNINSKWYGKFLSIDIKEIISIKSQLL